MGLYFYFLKTYFMEKKAANPTWKNNPLKQAITTVAREIVYPKAEGENVTMDEVKGWIAEEVAENNLKTLSEIRAFYNSAG